MYPCFSGCANQGKFKRKIGIGLVTLHDRPEMMVLGNCVYLIECADAGFAEFEKLAVIEEFAFCYYGAFDVK